MKQLTITILAASIFITGLAIPTKADLVTIDEARNVANNWLSLVLHYKGSWGQAETAQVVHIQDFKRDERTLGYYCQVKPKGFIMVSLLKGLAPIKAYSESSNLDPELDEGPSDLLKLKMEQMLDGIQRQLGPLSEVRKQDLESIVEIKHFSMWEALNVDKSRFRLALESDALRDFYEPGEELLSSSWHQSDPYSMQCPPPPAGDDCTDAHCRVGCVATAGSQIMRYWCWPPEYDWPNMPDEIDMTSPAEQIDAVAYLCSVVGIHAGAKYCEGISPCGSPSPTYVMSDVFETFRYHPDCCWIERTDYTLEEWWGGPGMITEQISVNRPIQYRILSHSVVCDGWKPGYWVHMNYGWDNEFTMWYLIYDLHQPNPEGTWEDEYMVLNIVPNVSLGSPIYGVFSVIEGFPYRYVDRNCYGGPAVFQPGQFIQFLHNISMEPTEGDFRIEGLSGYQSRLFTRGDISKGVRINNGTLKIMPGGGIKLY